MKITSTHAKSVLLISSLIAGTALLAGCDNTTTMTPSLTAMATSDAMMQKATPTAMMQKTPDAMMQKEVTVSGAAMLNGKMLSIGSQGEIKMMDKDMMLGDTKVMMDGKIMMKDGTTSMMKEGEEMMNDGSTKMVDSAMMMAAKKAIMIPLNTAAMGKAENTENGAMMQKSGTYAPYDTAKLAMAQSGKVVLFFHAGWCPHCIALDKDLVANADKIPAGVTILKIDYDTAKDLKAKYGVTAQNTFVEVDASGSKTKIFAGADSLAELTSKL